jgi:hypothetical protein
MDTETEIKISFEFKETAQEQIVPFARWSLNGLFLGRLMGF